MLTSEVFQIQVNMFMFPQNIIYYFEFTVNLKSSKNIQQNKTDKAEI